MNGLTDMMSAGQMLVDLEVYDFDTEDRVIPQIEVMTRSVRNSKFYCTNC